MDPVEDLNYLPNYQQLLFQDCANLLENSDTKRKCLVQTYSSSLKLLSSEDSLTLLKIKFNKTVDDNNEYVYENCIKSALPLNCDVTDNNSEWQSGLDDVDIKTLLKPLPCANSIYCEKTESISEENIQEIMKLFNQVGVIQQDSNKELKVRKIAKSFAPQCCSKDNRIVKNRVTSLIDNDKPSNTSVEQDKHFVNFTKEPEKMEVTLGEFKTAYEELNSQNLKKFGPRSVSQNQLSSGGQKRKLGTRRNVQSKFVSPMLSNNGSEELLPRNDDGPPNEVDERLKNIEPRMIELIRSEIMDSGATVDWDDIAGLEFAKTAIQEAVVWPLLRPDIFTGLRRPPKGILLFGPPGTGKTLIGKCVASQSKSTFFSISASSLTSKWIGDGEKMVRALFAVARCHQPAVIFIDEIDSLLSQRSETEHESSRRLKTEFLVQLDGATTDSDDRILVIGATNRPQELDEAARRRFVKRLYIPLPELQARLQLVTRLMTSEQHNLTDENIEQISRMSDGYSGADMKNLCSEASLGPIRCIDMRLIQSIEATEVRPVTMEDFIKAFTRVKSSVSPNDLDQYLIWNKTYGSGSF